MKLELKYSPLIIEQKEMVIQWQSQLKICQKFTSHQPLMLK
jgi:hypothetical protein